MLMCVGMNMFLLLSAMGALQLTLDSAQFFGDKDFTLSNIFALRIMNLHPKFHLDPLSEVRYQFDQSFGGFSGCYFLSLTHSVVLRWEHRTHRCVISMCLDVSS